MAAFVRYIDPVLIQVDAAYAGENWHDNRALFFGLSSITFGTGGLTGTQWYSDQGPVGMDATEKEPRNFCYRGGCEFSITACHSLVLRLNTAYSWLTNATVLVNGVAPSTLGLLTGLDTVSCDSATYGLNVDAYVDVLVLDGLTLATTYDIEIIADNADATKFFSIAGYKTGGRFTQPSVTNKSTYIVWFLHNLSQNHLTVSAINRQDKPILDVTLALVPAVGSPNLMNSDGTAYTDFTAAALQVGETETKVWAPSLTGDEVSDTYSYDATLSAFYPDPSGGTTLPTNFLLAATSSAITYQPSTWIGDSDTPDDSPRKFAISQSTAGFPWCLIFTFDGDAIDITTQRSAGWGVMGIYDGGTLGATLLNTVDCSVDEGGALHTYSLTGFGAGPHTVYLRKTVNDAAPIIFVRAAWTSDETYTEVVENFSFDIPMAQPVALRPVGTAIGDYDASWTNPDTGAVDYASAVVRSNAGVTTTEVLTRFPSFSVFYGTGLRELLSGYDVLIVDPLGARASDVIFWQSLGIKVFGYISSGEEVGFYAQPFNFASALAPRAGSGPGGFSTNYMFTKFAMTGLPDKNAIWSSYYLNPFPSSGWYDRIIDYYAPQCFGGPVTYTNEVVTTFTATTSLGPGVCFSTAHSPIDADQTITVKKFDLSHTYVIYQDYTFNVKTGDFVISPTASPAVTSGDQLKVTYTRKGHEFDGVFWDTVDTPDVYQSTAFGYEFVPGYKEAFAAFLNAFGAAYPSKDIIFNRGFTILDDIIRGAKGVMFESWLTLPDDPFDLANTDYHKVGSIPAEAAYVVECEHFLAQLRRLRKSTTFDVYSLNYAIPGSGGDALREYCRMVDGQHGFLSWQTVITLNNPLHNDEIDVSDPSAVSNAFTLYKRGQTIPPVWDAGASIWDAGASVWPS